MRNAGPAGAAPVVPNEAAQPARVGITVSPVPVLQHERIQTHSWAELPSRRRPSDALPPAHRKVQTAEPEEALKRRKNICIQPPTFCTAVFPDSQVQNAQDCHAYCKAQQARVAKQHAATLPQHQQSRKAAAAIERRGGVADSGPVRAQAEHAQRAQMAQARQTHTVECDATRQLTLAHRRQPGVCDQSGAIGDGFTFREVKPTEACDASQAQERGVVDGGTASQGELAQRNDGAIGREACLHAPRAQDIERAHAVQRLRR